MQERDIIRIRRRQKIEQLAMYPWICPCGESGDQSSMDLAHICVTRHPDHPALYSHFNTLLMHNACNIDVHWEVQANAVLCILERCRRLLTGIYTMPQERRLATDVLLQWHKSLPFKGPMPLASWTVSALDLWEQGVEPFNFSEINRHSGGPE